jgi:hypothetical protein
MPGAGNVGFDRMATEKAVPSSRSRSKPRRSVSHVRRTELREDAKRFSPTKCLGSLASALDSSNFGRARGLPVHERPISGFDFPRTVSCSWNPVWGSSLPMSKNPWPHRVRAEEPTKEDPASHQGSAGVGVEEFMEFSAQRQVSLHYAGGGSGGRPRDHGPRTNWRGSHRPTMSTRTRPGSSNNPRHTSRTLAPHGERDGVRGVNAVPDFQRVQRQKEQARLSVSTILRA